MIVALKIFFLLKAKIVLKNFNKKYSIIKKKLVFLILRNIIIEFEKFLKREIRSFLIKWNLKNIIRKIEITHLNNWRSLILLW